MKTFVGKNFHTFDTDGSFKWQGVRSEMAVTTWGKRWTVPGVNRGSRSDRVTVC